MERGNYFEMKKGLRGITSEPFIRGASRIRTGDPLLAKQMRYQLRYSPRRFPQRKEQREEAKWAWEDLNLRPHPYQGCALTS